MKKKKKMSETRKKQIDKSCCYECAFRYPLNHNPRSCLYGIRDEMNYDQDDHLRTCANCEHFIHEKLFKRNMDNMFGITKDLTDWASQMKLERSTVTVEIPTHYISSLIEFLVDRGESVESIRRMFGTEEKQ
jgi:hypothetical protein